MYVKDRGTKEL